MGPGDGSSTFALPDLRGRMPLGLDNMGGTSANIVTNAQADALNGKDWNSHCIINSRNAPTYSLFSFKRCKESEHNLVNTV